MSLLNGVTCFVCNELFVQPKLLPVCGHCFCLKCMLKVATGNCVVCPECESANQLGPEGPSGMKTVIQIERCVENYKREISTSQPLREKIVVDQDTCFHLSERKSSPSCSHCGLKLCRNCQFLHAERIKIDIAVKSTSFDKRIAGLDGIEENLKTAIAQCVSEAEIQINANCEALEEVCRNALDERKENLVLKVNELVNAKMNEFIACKANFEMKPAVKKAVQNLQIKSVLDYSLDELAEVHTEISDLDEKIQFVEQMIDRFKNTRIFIREEQDFASVANVIKKSEPPVEWVLPAEFEKDSFGPTLEKLHQAIRKGHFESVVEVLDQSCWSQSSFKALLESQDEKQHTALMLAVIHGRTDIARYLMKTCGADVKAVSGQNSLPLLHLAIAEGQADIVRDMIDCDPRLCAWKDKNGTPPLCQAAFLGNVQICSHLLDQKETDIEAEGKEKRTALLYAACGSNLQAVQFLVKKGARISARDEKGRTALHLSSYFGSSSIVDFLITTQPNLLGEVDIYGQTAYVLAKKNGKKDVMTVLQDFRQ